jgi:hypothetical protein
VARALGNTKWEYRAQGQLGFADFRDGDLPGAQRNVAQALIGAAKTGDIGGEIFYLSATAYGLTKQGMNDQSIQYADRAIAIADASPDAGYPIVAHQARLLAMVQAGQIGAAQEELKRLLNRKRQRKCTIDKRLGCELRDSLNFAYSQKIRFVFKPIACATYHQCGPPQFVETALGHRVHRTGASGCVPTGPTTHTLIAYCDKLILNTEEGGADDVHMPCANATLTPSEVHSVSQRPGDCAEVLSSGQEKL